jgi:hypothetical protein
MPSADGVSTTMSISPISIARHASFSPGCPASMLRKEDLRKLPGVAETLDWAATLAGLEVHDLRQAPEAVHETLMCLIKTHEDRAQLTREVTERLLGKVA